MVKTRNTWVLLILLLGIETPQAETVVKADANRTMQADVSGALDSKFSSLKGDMDNILRCGSQGYMYAPDYSPSSKVKHGGQQEGCLNPIEVM